MKTFSEAFEKIMMAAAFAEAGEFGTARQFVCEERPARRPRPDTRVQQRPTAGKGRRA